MPEIKWIDEDPESGGRRYLKAEKFGGKWYFAYRRRRRDVPWEDLTPTRAMWEHVLEQLRRRYQRREGVSHEEVQQVERMLKAWRLPPDEEEPP